MGAAPSRSAGILPAASIPEKLNRQGAKDAKGRVFLLEEKFRVSWVEKNRIHSLLGVPGVLAVQI